MNSRKQKKNCRMCSLCDCPGKRGFVQAKSYKISQVYSLSTGSGRYVIMSFSFGKVLFE